ncbi:MAG: hypothetical protein EPN53_01050 [Acidobacteria bacterium]|nr:MAG: hypothetical protein EPN53_01050 [Acidobacteriota bacterium]
MRDHAERCPPCAQALRGGGKLCSDGERLAEDARRHYERGKHITAEDRARRRELERWGPR